MELISDMPVTVCAGVADVCYMTPHGLRPVLTVWDGPNARGEWLVSAYAGARKLWFTAHNLVVLGR